MAECQLTTLAGCELVIGAFPRFLYNAQGGSAPGIAKANTPAEVQLTFSARDTTIPPLSWRTARFLGLPLPPGLCVAIQPMALSGLFDPSTGAMQLDFEARFRFQTGLGSSMLYTAPDLLVTTTLTTEAIESRRHRRQGRRLQDSDPGILVGVAQVNPCGERWLDRFLGLPDEALAVLECQLNLTESNHG
jgi:hypothetical protein